MEKVKSFLGMKMTIYGIIAVVLIVSGIFIFRNNSPVEETIIAQKENFLNQISASGKVVPTSSVDLGFKNGGRIGKVYFSVGDKVKKGQTLASLEANDALGSLEIAKANYQKLLNGATSNDIDVAKAAVETAQVSLDQAKLQQTNLVKNAKNNLLNSGFIATTDDGLSKETPPIISGTYLKDAEGQIIITEYSSSGGNSFKTSGLIDATGMVSSDIPQPIGDTGLYIKFNNTYDNSTKWILNIPNKQSPLYLQNFNTYQSALTTENQTIANATAILNQAKSELLLRQSGARQEDVTAALGSMQIAQGSYDNNFIVAPIDGIVTKVEAKAGEVASPNAPMISMISVGTFQIESYVPEVNIAGIKLGDEASSTLDAYGTDASFPAKVVSIDPAETIRDGISTYKIKLQFDVNDDRIRSGMTANVQITTESKPNIIVVPQGVIVDKSGKKFVQIEKNNQTLNTEVVTGSKSSLGQVEIVSGVNRGDVILLNPKIN